MSSLPTCPVCKSAGDKETIGTLRSFLKLRRASAYQALEESKRGLLNSITVSGKDANGVTMAEWGTCVTIANAELNLIDFLYKNIHELKPEL